MSYDCPRCHNTGVYFTIDWGFLRCLMCNANFYDSRSGVEIAASLPIHQIPQRIGFDWVDGKFCYGTVADYVGKEHILGWYDQAVMELEAVWYAEGTV